MALAQNIGVRKRLGHPVYYMWTGDYRAINRTLRSETLYASMYVYFQNQRDFVHGRVSNMSNDVIPAPAEKPKVTHIGYARISTEDQKMDLQIDALKKAGCQDMHIFRERASGSSTVRPELGLCLKTLREGDVLTVYKLDRLGRNMKELIRIVEWLEENKIGF